MEITRQTVFAAALYALWRRSTGETRTLIAEAIAAYLQRHPQRKADFEAAVQYMRLIHMPKAGQTDVDTNALTVNDRQRMREMRNLLWPGSHAHAVAILQVWLNGDKPLREAIQAYTRMVVQTEPAVLKSFKALLPRGSAPS
ncbi:MAG: hypothetical protein MUD01_19250 [Chloroflexaceae bacterium]|nr:hypothetical protein [Chloroflexaceae bacterium]